MYLISVKRIILEWQFFSEQASETVHAKFAEIFERYSYPVEKYAKKLFDSVLKYNSMHE